MWCIYIGGLGLCMEMRNIMYSTILNSQWASGLWISKIHYCINKIRDHNWDRMYLHNCVFILFLFATIAGSTNFLMVHMARNHLSSDWLQLLGVALLWTWSMGNRYADGQITTYLHHTVQAAMSARINQCTLVNVLLGIETNNNQRAVKYWC